MSSSSIQYVASLAPNQHHCNLKLRVLSVETIAETVHPGNQVNLLARNARLQLLNAHVNMYRGFMRLEVNEDEEGRDGFEYEGQCRPSITTVVDEEDDSNGLGHESSKSDNKSEETTTSTSTPTTTMTTENHSRAIASSSTTASPETAASQQPLSNASTSLATIAVATVSSASQSFTSSPPSTSSRDQLEVEMRLGSGGSVSLMEYYRMAEFTYFPTMEPVGR
ncbi:hypothetical protein BG011_008115 [Mortierella polycephala]|uniref:Single-stranded DNA binding protein Ssb-like OB fold domain-containing protein n=1 Tax=Mortierella polycephala TaxID=41804 RepID=A0A9P6PR66_9FUNG|nr:hypothetical protein BG011_008115 [Mortierella polycephala]